MADSVPEVNPYEAERAARIAANQLKLQQLGLDTAVARFRSLTGGVEVPAHYGQPRKRQKKAQPQVATEVLEASRQSRRIRGAAALTSEDIKQLPEVQAASTQGSSALGCTRTGRPRSQLTVPPYPIVAPFTLRSIDVTVWELGSVYRGPWAQRYWSSSGCLFHHAYPVGYRASKVQFGRTFGMAIEAGPQGPIFKVTDQITGVTYSGTSPTKPWTDVCLAQRTGQRISGPLYFGFSDLVTQQAIAALYTPAELEAATQGERLGNAELTSEERAAKEFMEVDGIGETTAMVLALTFALGGRQHTTLQSLKGWAKEGDNAISLQHFLLHSPEMPEATRRWPAWRHRMVTQIMQTILDIQPLPPPAQQSRKGKAAPAGAPAPGAAEQSCPQQDAGSDGAQFEAAATEGARPAAAAAASFALSAPVSTSGVQPTAMRQPALQSQQTGRRKATASGATSGKENQARRQRQAHASGTPTASEACTGKQAGKRSKDKKAEDGAGAASQPADGTLRMAMTEPGKVGGRKRQLTAKFAAFVSQGAQ